MNAEHFKALANREADRELNIAVAEFKVAIKEASFDGKTKVSFIKREVERFIGRIDDSACSSRSAYPAKLARFCQRLENEGFQTSFTKNSNGNWFFGISWAHPKAGAKIK